MKPQKISENHPTMQKTRNGVNNKPKTIKALYFHLVEQLALPLEGPVWYPTIVKPGQSISIKAIVEYLNIDPAYKRKAVLLMRAYNEAGEEVDVSFNKMAKSEAFDAHFKYLAPTQDMLEELYTFIVPEGVATIHFGFNRFLCSENEQVLVNDLVIYSEAKAEVIEIPNNYLVEQLALPLEGPVWYPTIVKPGQSISIKAIVEYLNIDPAYKRKAVLLMRAYNEAGEEVDVSFNKMAKSEAFDAHFKYLAPTQDMLEELYTFIVPEGVATIHFGFNRFLCSENEQVLVNDLVIYSEAKAEVIESLKQVNLTHLQDVSIEKLDTTPNTKIIANNIQNPVIEECIVYSNRLEPLKHLKDLRVSAIMDEFTYKSYIEECEIDQLSIYSWEKQLNDFKPDLLFVESAWRGFNDEWDRKISNSSPELEKVIEWCNRRNIPTLFWNKEDPVHFESFINIAEKFDTVFTTDLDCIERYKSILEHDNIYWLPFAAQLNVNNPIEKYERKDAFCFAGSYYVKYPSRTKDLNNFVNHFSKVKPFIIYDRNYHKNDENYKFPLEFKFFIKGNLPFEKIDKAYKGYNYTINLNSVKQSQSMFARRVYEVLASNTILVSNYSRGLRMIFGDLVLSSDSPKQILKQLQPFFDDNLLNSYFKLLGLRKVLSEHTYTHRLNHIVNKTLGFNLASENKVYVFSVAKNEKDIKVIIEKFEKQVYEFKELVILNTDKSIRNSGEYTVLYSLEELEMLANQIDSVDFISYFSNYDYYGEYYLYDLVLATSFSNGRVVGKSSHFVSREDDLLELNESKTYAIDELISLRASLIPKDIFLELVKLSDDLESTSINKNTVAIDYFNYCKDYYKFSFKNKPVELMCISNINTGLKVEDFDKLINMIPRKKDDEDTKFIDALELFNHFPKVENKDFTLRYYDQRIVVKSGLESNKHAYQYIADPINISEFSIKAGAVQRICFDIGVGLNLQLVFKYLDKDKNNISHSMIYGMRNTILEIPSNCQFISIGLRVYGPGETVINKVLLGHKVIDPTYVVSDKEYLLVTNHYPSYDDLYRNGFVHSRLRSYKKEGIEAEVFRLRKTENVSYHEFEGIDVTTGSNNALEKMIENNNFKTILVHFLDENIWDTLSKYVHTHKIIIWVHGAEIQTWQRREFEFERMNKSEIERQKILSDHRVKFWQNLIDNNLTSNINFVFVSEYFLEESEEGLCRSFPRNKVSIIHNYVDKNQFKYQPKAISQRFNILSIRPYASRKYANDLTVKTIIELSKHHDFEKMTFKLYGDGELFEKTTEPLKNFDNVQLHKGFLSHTEIAKAHRENGIFITPTRMDSQGVSRDEAMSSGLVPVTTAVTAIPEFVDDSCGVLAESEDYKAMAKGIVSLIESPKMFKRLSQAASKRVEAQSGFKNTIAREVVLINNI